MRLLLASNSRTGDDPWLSHLRAPLARHFAGARRLAFLPFAGVTIDWTRYTRDVAATLAPDGVPIAVPADPHDAAAMRALLAEADGILVGGGNTFHLLHHLHESGALGIVRERVRAGVPYAGWSAGAVVSGPTLGTTNDMPIIAPAAFEALALVPFQINAHFTDAHPPGFRGETRRERLAEFVTVNRDVTVVGLPEGDWLEIDGAHVTLHGPHPAPVLRYGADPDPLLPGRVDGALPLASPEDAPPAAPPLK